MWVKICANTNLDDALLAASLGADALGFVFAPSPRRVTAEQVAAITRDLPAAVETIGVFTSVDPEEIRTAVQTAGLTGVQLHSAYDPSLIAQLAAQLSGVRLIQTTHRSVAAHDPAAGAEEIVQLRTAPHLQAVLVDSRTAGAAGGTGIAFDWETAHASLKGLAPMPLIVAGGLHPENVQEAIRVLQPWGVDVASGVEAAPGRKDPRKLAAFIAQARLC